MHLVDINKMVEALVSVDNAYRETVDRLKLTKEHTFIYGGWERVRRQLRVLRQLQGTLPKD